MQFRDHIYRLTPEGGEQLLTETRESLENAKAKLTRLSKQKAKAMEKYDAALKECRDEITGYMNVITMIEQVVFGNTDISPEEIQQIINDDSVPF